MLEIRIDCTFWDNWALLWDDYEERFQKHGHVDFILMLGKVRYWDSKFCIALSHNLVFVYAQVIIFSVL